MATCPLCEAEIPDVNLKADSYYFTGFARCDKCDKEVSPVLPQQENADFMGAIIDSQELRDGLAEWFKTPTTAREQFLSSLESDQTGRIASKILKSFDPR